MKARTVLEIYGLVSFYISTFSSKMKLSMFARVSLISTLLGNIAKMYFSTLRPYFVKNEKCNKTRNTQFLKGMAVVGDHIQEVIQFNMTVLTQVFIILLSNIT